MGWTGTPMFTNDRKQVVARHMYSNEERFTVLKSSMVGTTCYMAVRNNQANEVFAVVALTSVRDGYLYYKDMNETSEPYYCDCPKSILALLTPTHIEGANNWRKACAERKAKPKKPKLTDGATVTFKQPLTFVNGDVLYTFKVEKYGRQVRFRNGYNLYIIKNWNKREYEIVKA